MPLLDEGLPTFLFSSNSNKKDSHDTAVYHTQNGSEPEPTYIFRTADPSTPAAKNCYAIALFDAYNPEVLFGEVLVRPRWSQPTLSQDEIRKNGGIPPPPEPMTPPGFTIQLYDPDQQVSVTYKDSSILGSAKWDFSMPQDTFRTPSASMIDKSLNDPGAAATTPKITFSWKKEKLGRELVCFYTGKSTDGLVKRKHKEPDVTCAILKSLKQLTVYESNLSRIDLEDPKGFEVVLLLSAAVIRDVYFGNLRQTFNIAEVPRRTSTSQTAAIKPTTSPVPVTHPLRVNQQPAAAAGLYQTASPSQAPPLPSTRPPPHDARAQWEIDQETARLRALAEAEARELRAQEEKRRRERERAAEEETKRLRKIVEEEEKQRRRREREIEEETERLRRQYGVPGEQPPPQPPRPIFQASPQQQQMPGAWPSPQQGYGYDFQVPPPQQHGLMPQSGYYNAPAPPDRYAGSPWDGSSSGVATSAHGGSGSSANEQGRKPSGGKPKKSFWDLRSDSKVSKKSSSVW